MPQSEKGKNCNTSKMETLVSIAAIDDKKMTEADVNDAFDFNDENPKTAVESDDDNSAFYTSINDAATVIKFESS